MQRMLLRVSILLICAIACSCAFAADAYVDSYETKLREADRFRSSKSVHFTELLNQLREDKTKPTTLQKQKFRYLLAYKTAVYDKYGNHVDDAIKQAKSLFDETKDVELKYRSASLVTNLSAIKREFSTGLKYLDKTLRLRNRIVDKNILHDGMGAAAFLYNQIGQYGTGLEYANQVLNDSPSKRTQCTVGHEQVESNFQLGKLVSDDPLIEQNIELCSSIDEPIPANLSRATLARQLAKEGNAQAAIALLEKALPEVLATNYTLLIAEIRSILAQQKLVIGDLPAAELQAKATVALGNALYSTQALVSAYNTLYTIAEKRGRPVEALSLYKRYAEANQARQNDIKARDLVYVTAIQETQKETLDQKNEIERLNRNNLLLSLQGKLGRENAQKAKLGMILLFVASLAIVVWALQMRSHQAQLQLLAQTDTLTGIGNRHYFTLKSERSLVEAARAGESASLVMFDLDHFKAINDTYGHGAGDWVLKQVGKCCAAHCRKIDYIGRLGGEEFAILLRGLDLATAARLAEDCRAKLAQLDTRECGFTFVVTASFGVSSSAQSGYDLSRLLSHADQMLYRAKNEGRNRVCTYTVVSTADQSSKRGAPALTVVNG